MGNAAALAISNVVSVSGFLSEVGVNRILIVWIVDTLLYVLIREGLRAVKVSQRPRHHESLRKTLTVGWGFVRDIPSFTALTRIAEHIGEGD
jgi:hypothetical protein